MLPQLSLYIRKFSKLKTASLNGEPAPHKAVLLLAVISLIEERTIQENKISISPELVLKFKELFRVLASDKFTANFSLPFYHLKSSGFWHLRTHSGREILLTSSASIKSFSHLKEVIAYAYLSDDLFNLLMDGDNCQILKQTLLSTYFKDGALKLAENQPSLFEEVAHQILSDSTIAYQIQVAQADEEEIFIRGGVFKKVVPKVYNYSCCISGMRIIGDRDVQMVDACHIIPFSESHDDTISNGISLCPNLHRAFDRHLISIDENYKVHVATGFTEGQSEYGIKTYAGRSISLPKEIHYQPSRESLARHFQVFVSKNN